MPIRAALATTDERTINEHFGKTTSFSIYEIGVGSIQLIERRNVVPLAEISGGHETGLSVTMESLKDCRIVAAARIGGAVRRQLAAADVTAFTSEENIDDFLTAIAKSRLFAKQIK